MSPPVSAAGAVTRTSALTGRCAATGDPPRVPAALPGGRMTVPEPAATATARSPAGAAVHPR
jgi:hypothetical protein